MAESIVLTCDESGCGNLAVEQVTIRTASRGNLAKDLCRGHFNDLVQGTRLPQRGRKRAALASIPGETASVSRRSPGRPKGSKDKNPRKSAAKRSAAKRRGAKRVTARKRTGAKRGPGRPRKVEAAAAAE